MRRADELCRAGRRAPVGVVLEMASGLLLSPPFRRGAEMRGVGHHNTLADTPVAALPPPRPPLRSIATAPLFALPPWRQDAGKAEMRRGAQRVVPAPTPHRRRLPPPGRPRPVAAPAVDQGAVTCPASPAANPAVGKGRSPDGKGERRRWSSSPVLVLYISL